MEDKDKEKITIEYLRNLMDTDTNQCMMVFGSVMKELAEKANSGQLKVTISDKKDVPIWTLLFVTDNELIPLLDDFIDKYDEEYL